MPRKHLALALALMMALSLAAAFPAQAEAGAVPAYLATDYGMEPFAEPVTIKIPVFDRARDDVPPVDHTFYTDWINENFGAPLNVTVEFIPITRTDTMGSYNLLLAGGDWPTVFMEYDWPKVSQWNADGALAEIDTAAFAEIAPTWTEKAGGVSYFDAFKMEGVQKVLPALRPYWDTNYTYVTFYRKDWYRKAGLELYTTYEEYVAALQTFMELGYTNGKPIIAKGPFTENFQVYGDSEWPRNEEEWVMYSDVSVAPLPARGAYYALKKQNYEYSLGLYSTEFELDVEGAGSASQAITDFINGEAYSYANYLGADMPDLTAFYANNPDAELGIIGNNTVYDTGKDQWGGHVEPQARATNPAGMFVGFSSKATADELKAAWMYMEYVAQPDVLFFLQNGVEGETYNLDADGLPVIVGGYQGDYWMGYGNNKDYWCIAVEVRTVGTIEQTIASIAPQGLPQDFTQELIDNYYLLKMYADDGLLYVDPFFSVNIDSVSEYAGDLKAKFVEYATALVKCDPADFDALYEQYVQEYKDAGYQEIMDERLAAYQAGLSTVLPDIAAGRAPFSESDITQVLPTLYTIGQ